MMKFLTWCRDEHIQAIVEANDFGFEFVIMIIFGWIKKQQERIKMESNQVIRNGVQIDQDNLQQKITLLWT